MKVFGRLGVLRDRAQPNEPLPRSTPSTRHFEDAPPSTPGVDLQGGASLVPGFRQALRDLWSGSTEATRRAATLAEVRAVGGELAALTDAALAERSATLRAKVRSAADTPEARKAALDAVLPEAFALVAEALRRNSLGPDRADPPPSAEGEFRLHDFQLEAALIMHEGDVAQVRMGGGKTFSLALTGYLHSLVGRGVHVGTQNDYLAKVAVGSVMPALNLLGVRAAAIDDLGGAMTWSPTRHTANASDPRLANLVECTRQEAYQADLTYGSIFAFGYDRDRDQLAVTEDALLCPHRARGELFSFLVDEADELLVDQARTDIVVSDDSHPQLRAIFEDDCERLPRVAEAMRQLRRLEIPAHAYEKHLDAYLENAQQGAPGEPAIDPDSVDYYVVHHPGGQVATYLTENGIARVEAALGLEPGALYGDNGGPLSGYEEHVTLMLRALEYKFGKDVVERDGQVALIEPSTGRITPGKQLGDGVQQALQALAGLPITPRMSNVAATNAWRVVMDAERRGATTGTAEALHRLFKSLFGMRVLEPRMPPRNRTDEVQTFFHRPVRDLTLSNRVREARNEGRFTLVSSQDFAEGDAALSANRTYALLCFDEAVAAPDFLLKLENAARQYPQTVLGPEEAAKLPPNQAAEAAVRELQAAVLRGRVAVNQALTGEEVLNLTDPMPRVVLTAERLQVFLDALGPSAGLYAKGLESFRRLEPYPPEKEGGPPRFAVPAVLHADFQLLTAERVQYEREVVARGGRPGAVLVATEVVSRGTDIPPGGTAEAWFNDFFNYAVLKHQQEGLPPPDPAHWREHARAFAAEQTARAKALGALVVITDRGESERDDDQVKGRIRDLFGFPGSTLTLLWAVNTRPGDARSGFQPYEEVNPSLLRGAKVGSQMAELLTHGRPDAEGVLEPLPAEWDGAFREAQELQQAAVEEELLERAKYDNIVHAFERQYETRLQEARSAPAPAELWMDAVDRATSRLVERCARRRWFGRSWVEPADLAEAAWVEFSVKLSRGQLRKLRGASPRDAQVKLARMVRGVVSRELNNPKANPRALTVKALNFAWAGVLEAVQDHRRFANSPALQVNRREDVFALELAKDVEQMDAAMIRFLFEPGVRAQ